MLLDSIVSIAFFLLKYKSCAIVDVAQNPVKFFVILTNGFCSFFPSIDISPLHAYNIF